MLLTFVFWEPVYYAVNEATFPETPQEALGRFVGIADVVGALVTFKILTEDMKVITWSVVRTATTPGPYQNLRANARSPTLAPKPVTHKLRVNDHSKDIVVETVDEDEDEAECNDHEINEGEDVQPDPNVNPTPTSTLMLPRRHS